MTKLNAKFVETVTVDSSHWTWASDGKVWTLFAMMTEIENETEGMKQAHNEVSPAPCLNAMEREGSVGLNNAGFALERWVTALLCACTSVYCFSGAACARLPETAMVSIGQYACLKIVEVLGEIFHHNRGTL